MNCGVRLLNDEDIKIKQNDATVVDTNKYLGINLNINNLHEENFKD